MKKFMVGFLLKNASDITFNKSTKRLDSFYSLISQFHFSLAIFSL